MKRIPNKLREKLTKGQTVTGTVSYSWSPNIIDVAGLAGLDYVRIDTEHSWRRDDMLEQLVRAAILGDVVPIIRIDRGNPYLARKALEIGAGGIIVPDVRTVEEAEAVVRMTKFPPEGIRGYSGMCWSGGWGAKAGSEWISWSNSEPLIGIMIENVTAMDNISQIMAVSGIDFALFGPSDFSMSLGLGAPNASDKRIQEAIRETVDAAHRFGKHVSLGVGTDSENIKKHVELGIDMLELGSDLGVIRSVWQDAANVIAKI